RSAARSGDPQTARIGLRALGRLERASLIVDILPGLQHRLPEVRAEAGNAVAQAAQGLRDVAGPRPGLTAAQAALSTRLDGETDAGVRAVLCEAIARLPYVDAADIDRAESTLVGFAERATTSEDRLGLAKGLEALARLHRERHRVGQPALALLQRLARADPGRPEPDLLRDARVRRLALEALIAIGDVDIDTAAEASTDPDTQVRRLAMRAVTTGAATAMLARGLVDPEPMVRIEALRSMRSVDPQGSCRSALAGSADRELRVALVATDLLAACGDHEAAVAYLRSAVADPANAESSRNWHRAAHALIALAAADPEGAAVALTRYVSARAWQLRVAAARAATPLKNRELLQRLAQDSHDNVVEAAVVALSSVVGHDADDLYVAALLREGDQVIRVAARALDHTPKTALAVPALKAAYQRIESSTRPGASDARSALRATLASLGVQIQPPRAAVSAAPLSAAELRRLASPRARFVMRDVGQFEVALFTIEAPATVLQFAQLAQSGYYDGLTFHRVVPNGVIQGGSPGANEFSSNATLMRDEVGLWPHVRGAVGISTRGHDTGDAQIFIDLVDNPRYDHTYTVFAQVLNGMDIVDRLMEGDVIDSVEILP
ncbi:MAG: peptidylprolyl isomerase, partial [Vicinamibacterales bacterium]